MATIESVKEILDTLVGEFKAHRADISQSIRNIEQKLDGITTRVSANEREIKELTQKVNTNTDDIQANNFNLTELKTKIELLEKDNDQLAKSFDE